jgi:hypothetical protein
MVYTQPSPGERHKLRGRGENSAATNSLAGRATEAIPLLEQGVDQKGPHYLLRVAYLSEGYLRVGQIDQAMQLAERAG